MVDPFKIDWLEMSVTRLIRPVLSLNPVDFPSSFKVHGTVDIMTQFVEVRLRMKKPHPLVKNKLFDCQ